MATRRKPSGDEPAPRRRRPADTPEARENQLINAAFDLAEKQLREGTASSQVITQFLKLGSSREKLEQERLKHEVQLMEAKREIMGSEKRIEELFGDAINAFRGYQGKPPLDKDRDDED